MSKNIEIKVLLKSHKEIKQILKKNQIKFAEFLNQKDVYFNVKNGILKLRIENGKQTLIFYNRNENSKKRWSDYYLLDLSGIDAEKYFRRFLEVIVVVKKKRELYLYDNTRIHLDYVTGLGYFLELETRVVNGLKDAEIRFSHLIDLLKLRDYTELKTSYKDLLIKGKAE